MIIYSKKPVPRTSKFQCKNVNVTSKAMCSISFKKALIYCFKDTFDDTVIRFW